MFNGKTYVLGDIHGVLEPLEKVEKIVDLSKDRVFLLGDYIDRGNEGYKVLKYLMGKNTFDPESSGIHCLLGNHDVNLLIDIIDYNAYNTEDSEYVANFIRESLNLPSKYNLDKINLFEIQSFLFELPLIYKITLNDKNYFLVHAALPSGRIDKLINTRLSNISKRDYDKINYILWERENFLFNTDVFHSKDKNIVIFGHTPVDKMKGWKENGYKNLLQDGSTSEIVEIKKNSFFKCRQKINLVHPVINESRGYINIDTFGVCNFRYPDVYQNLSYTLLNLDDLTYTTIQKQ